MSKIPVAWLKVHRHRGKLEAEARALRAWLPAVGIYGPTCTVLSEVACLLSHVSGRPMDTPDLPQMVLRAGLRTLGDLVGRLHRLPWPDDDPIPLSQAIPAREAAWLARAQADLPSALYRHCAATFAAPLSSLRRVPCHRDLTLDNVLIDEGRVCLLDFGQSRMDEPLADWVKLFELPESSTHLSAFEEGYGATAEDVGGGHLRRAVLRHGLATFVWGRKKGDEPATERGLEILFRHCT
ncbi:MAG: phosphotransferase [Bradymonadia bacterium]